MTVYLGDYVATTKHRNRGRVHGIHHSCPENEGWLQMQTPPITDAERKEPWVSVLCDGGGAVVVPMSDCTAIAPFPFRNNWSTSTSESPPTR